MIWNAYYISKQSISSQAQPACFPMHFATSSVYVLLSLVALVSTCNGKNNPQVESATIFQHHTLVHAQRALAVAPRGIAKGIKGCFGKGCAGGGRGGGTRSGSSSHAASPVHAQHAGHGSSSSSPPRAYSPSLPSSRTSPAYTTSSHSHGKSGSTTPTTHTDSQRGWVNTPSPDSVRSNHPPSPASIRPGPAPKSKTAAASHVTASNRPATRPLRIGGGIGSSSSSASSSRVASPTGKGKAVRIASSTSSSSSSSPPRRPGAGHPGAGSSGHKKRAPYALSR